MAEEVAQNKGVEDVKKTDKGDQVVTPWVAHAGVGDKGIDYEKLISESTHNYTTDCHAKNYLFITGQFGSQRINEELLQKIEAATKQKPHHFLRRGIFFSHR